MIKWIQNHIIAILAIGLAGASVLRDDEMQLVLALTSAVLSVAAVIVRRSAPSRWIEDASIILGIVAVFASVTFAS